METVSLIKKMYGTPPCILADLELWDHYKTHSFSVDEMLIYVNLLCLQAGDGAVWASL